MRQGIVSYEGHDSNKGEAFSVTISCPDATPGDPPASPNLTNAIRRFYDESLDGFTDSQAHALLTYRDFAKACIAALYPEVYGKRAALYARFAACYISADESRAASVQDWCEARFDRGDDPDDMPAAVGRHQAFDGVQRFLVDALADAKELGADV